MTENDENQKKKLPSQEDFNKAIDEMTKKQEEILENQKTPYELLTKITGIVKKVTNNNRSTYAPQEFVCGPMRKAHPTGYKNTLEIQIESKTIKHLKFNGYSIVKGGDEINFYVVKGKEETLLFPEFNNSIYNNCSGQSKSRVLVEGDLVEKMQAYEIEIIEGKRIVRTDIAIDKPMKPFN